MNNREQLDLEVTVTDYLDKKGFKRNILGFRYLRTAIALSVKDIEIVYSVTKKLYPSVAEEYSTTSSKVERAIRHAIEIVYTENKPCNSEFIALAADEIRLSTRKS